MIRSVTLAVALGHIAGHRARAPLPDMINTVATALGVFVGTNVDDLVVLTVLFLTSRAIGKPRPWQIVAGQCIGIGALVAFSVIAALGLVLVPDAWVGLLGLIPIGLGVYGLIAAFRARHAVDAPPAVPASGVLSVAGVTLANGADNLAIYTPLFRTMTLGGAVITIAVFGVMVALWCGAGALLGGHPRVVALVERCGPWLVPIVFIVIGTVIVIDSGVVGRLMGGA